MTSFSALTTRLPGSPPKSSTARSQRQRHAAARAAAAPATARYSQRLEHMDTVRLHKEVAAQHKYHDLDLAESELGSHCSRLPPEAETEKCWQAYNFLERKREAAAAGCQQGKQEDCQALDRLNDMAHQLLSTGSVDDLVATFSTLAKVEQLRASREAKKAAEAAQRLPAEAQPTADPLHALFAQLDADSDGRLSIAEFRRGMVLLGDELEGATVALIMDAMDVHGFLDEQQFRDIVDAERLNSHNHIVTFWRHHHPQRPGWWTGAPGKGSVLA